MKPKVIYWNNIPTPYIIERFNAVTKRGNLDFKAWFTDMTGPDRSWKLDSKEWLFPYRLIPCISLAGKKIHLPPFEIMTKKMDLLVAFYSDPAMVSGLATARLRGVKTALWCQVTPDGWFPKRAWKEVIKKTVISNVDAVFGSGEESRAYAMHYGAGSDRAMKLRHAIDVDFFSRVSTEARQTREEERKKLGVKRTAFMYVGRLWWGKGLNFLIEAFSELQKSGLPGCEETTLFIAGDGPDEKRLRDQAVALNLRNVIFLGYVQKEELPRYYALSDVFVFPTLGDPYGLVVDEAMACELPVISTSAAGEIGERIEEGINGFIVPPKDSHALSSAMQKFCIDPGLSLSMGRQSRAKIEGHTPEQWAIDFESIVVKILSNQS